MAGKLSDYQRKLRVWYREARYSALMTGGRRNELIEARLTHLFRLTNRFLSDLGVDYWLVYGTLLGQYRCNQLIPGDRDLDFGAGERDYQTIWGARHLLPVGLTMYDTSHNHYGPKLCVTWEGWEADLYFYRDDGATLQCYEKSPNIGDRAPFPRTYVYPKRAATFLGEATFIPNDSLAYLTHTYGYIGANAVKDPKTGYWYPKEKRDSGTETANSGIS